MVNSFVRRTDRGIIISGATARIMFDEMMKGHPKITSVTTVTVCQTSRASHAVRRGHLASNQHAVLLFQSQVSSTGILGMIRLCVGVLCGQYLVRERFLCAHFLTLFAGQRHKHSVATLIMLQACATGSRARLRTVNTQPFWRRMVSAF